MRREVHITVHESWKVAQPATETRKGLYIVMAQKSPGRGQEGEISREVQPCRVEFCLHHLVKSAPYSPSLRIATQFPLTTAQRREVRPASSLRSGLAPCLRRRSRERASPWYATHVTLRITRVDIDRVVAEM